MNRKQKIIVSVTGIFLVLLILVGLTYAYFLTQIVGNTNEKSISVTTSNLQVKYEDGTNIIFDENTKMIPSASVIGEKTFNVVNNGDPTKYVIIIENVIIKNATTEEYTTFESNDFVYDLSCSIENVSPVRDIFSISNKVLPMSDSQLSETINIGSNENHTCNLKLYYLDNGEDQSADMNKTIEARVNIEDPNRMNPYSSNTNSLAYNIINNALTVTNDEINDRYAAYRSRPLTTPAEEISAKYIGVEPSSFRTQSMTRYQDKYYVVGDDYTGTGGFKLVNPRVVKYSEGYEELKGKYITSNWGYSSDTANTEAEEGKTFGYLYKVGESTTTSTMYYESVSKKEESVESSLSVMPDDYTAVIGHDSYYYRGGVENNYIEFNNMCWRIVRIEGDGSVKITLVKQDLCSTITDENTGSAFIGTGDYGYDTNYYPDYENSQNSTTSMKYKFNEWFNTNMSSVSNKLKTTQICIGDTTTKYDSSGNKLTDSELSEHILWSYEDSLRLAGNNQATLVCNVQGKSVSSYQIYPLTADEIVFAGGKVMMPNFTYYLMENAYDNSWRTLSLGGFNTDDMTSAEFVVFSNGSTSTLNYIETPIESYSLRPAVSLIPGIELASASGDGTQTNPYRVVES